MERLPATIALMRFAGTWISWASWFMLTPRSSSVSFRISPGWTGGSLAIVLRNFGIFGMSFLKSEANPVLVVNPDAVLPFAIATQRFQAVAGRDKQIGNCFR